MSQTLTYTIGADKRALVSDAQDFHIDFTSDNSNWVQARQYEDSMRQVFVNVKNQDGTPYNLMGTNIWFEGILPDKTHKILDANHAVILDATNGQFRFDMPKQAFAVAGSYQQAFFRIVRDGDSVTTLEFDLEVLADKVISNLVARDYITPFEDLYDQLKAILDNGQKNADQAINNWSQKLNDTYNTLTTAGADVQTQLNNLITEIKANNLVTTDTLGDFSQIITPAAKPSDKVLAISNDKGVNVANFGAVGDGKTDNVNAIQKAVNYATDNGINAIYFPTGRFFTSGHDIALSKFTVRGAGRYQTTLVKSIANPFFELRTGARIESIGFEDNSTEDSTIVVVNNNDGISSSWDISIDDFLMRGNEANGASNGDWNTTAIKMDLNKKGLWDVHLSNGITYWTDYGILVDTYNDGWFTGSIFHDLTIKGFAKAAIAMISNNNTARQISQNSFHDVTAEVLYKTATNAIGYILSGTANNFDNLYLFNDGAYSGKAIQLKFYGASSTNAQTITFGKGVTTNNRFSGGCLEGTIDDPDSLYDYQQWDHMILQGGRDDGQIDQKIINSVKKPDLISQAVIEGGMNYFNIVQNNSGSSYYTGNDENGRFFQYTTGAQGGYFNLPLVDPKGTESAIKDNQWFSIGLKYKSLDNETVTPISFVGLRMATAEYPIANRKYYFENSADGITERVDIWNNSSEYWATYDKSKPLYDGLWIYVRPNRVVRFYDFFLTAGQTSSFNSIERRNPINSANYVGGINYIQSPNKILTRESKEAFSASSSTTFAIDSTRLSWQRSKNVTLSFDVNATNFNSTNVTSRLSLYMVLTVTFTDASQQAYYCGFTNGLTYSNIRDRIFTTIVLPEQHIKSAIVNLVASQGLQTDYIQFGRPQIEFGTIAHDFQDPSNSSQTVVEI